MALKPPPGMSLMEEIKWKAEQKAKNGGAAPAAGGGGGGGAGGPTPPKPNAHVSPAKPIASPTAGAKPPPGLSMMEEMKWKQQQKAAAEKNGGASPTAAPSHPAPSGGGGADKPFKPPPPPGRKTEINGGPKPLKPPGSLQFPPNKTESPPKPEGKAEGPPKVANSLASRQAMLAGILGGGGGGGPAGGGAAKSAAPQPKKDGPPPAKKWGTVQTDGSGAGSSTGGGGGGSSGAAAKLGMPPDMTKYEKMMKMLPQGAVENAMVRDGFDPGYLFENCVTIKSDKKPIKGGGGGGGGESAPAPAAPAPVSAPSPAAPPAMAPAPPAPHAPQHPGSFTAPQQAFGLPPAAPPPMGNPPQQAPMMPHQGYAPPPPPPGMYGQPQANVWTQQFSPQYGAYFYFNSQTGEMSWTPPPDMGMPPPQPFLAIMRYPFTPTGYNPEEMQVFENDQIEVFDVGADGWVYCRCLRTNIVGLVPQNYTNIG